MVGQAEIQDDQIRVLGGNRFQGFAAAGGFQDGVSLGAEGHPKYRRMGVSSSTTRILRPFSMRRLFYSNSGNSRAIRVPPPGRACAYIFPP